MAKGKGTKAHAMMYKTLHRKLKIELLLHWLLGSYSTNKGLRFVLKIYPKFNSNILKYNCFISQLLFIWRHK